MISETAAQQMELTVCICTRNRPEDLATAIESVRTSSVAVSQIVVSDDSTDHRVKSLVEQRFPGIDFVEGPRKGLCANRNAALTAAGGTHVLFIDDDATLGKDFLAAVKALLEDPPPELRARTIVTGLERQRGMLVYPKDQTFFGYQQRNYRNDEPLNTVVINATVFPIKLFEQVGFDTNLIYGCDEVDLTTRAVALGYRIVLCEQAVNDHYPSPVNRDFYQPHVNASRLYVTLKRYIFSQRKYGRAFCFILLAPLHLVATLVKRNGAAGFKAAAFSTLEALRYFFEYARRRPDAAPRIADPNRPHKIHR